MLRHLVNGVVQSTRYTPLFGSSHNLIVQDNILHVVGGGEYSWTADSGNTWNCGAYEAQNFPKLDFNYGVAHTMKSRSGAHSKRFLQEVVEKSTGRAIVIELSISEHGATSSSCHVSTKEPISKQYLQEAAIPDSRAASLLAASTSNQISN